MTRLLFVIVSSLLLWSSASAMQLEHRRSELGGCAARDATAVLWERQTTMVFRHEVPGWCVVARLLTPGRWQAEQWRAVDREATGWRVTAELAALRPDPRLVSGAEWAPADGVVIRVTPLTLQSTFPSALEVANAHQELRLRHGVVGELPAMPEATQPWISHASRRGESLSLLTIPVDEGRWVHVVFQRKSPQVQP